MTGLTDQTRRCLTGDDTPTSRHGRGDYGSLCDEPHICPACEAGGQCVDLFMHPICGLVACDSVLSEGGMR